MFVEYSFNIKGLEHIYKKRFQIIKKKFSPLVIDDDEEIPSDTEDEDDEKEKEKESNPNANKLNLPSKRKSNLVSDLLNSYF